MSLSSFGVDEAGIKLEENLFGGELNHITTKAALFLVSDTIQNLDQFTQKFKELNMLRPGTSKFRLKNSSDLIFIGRCGSHFKD